MQGQKSILIQVIAVKQTMLFSQENKGKKVISFQKHQFWTFYNFHSFPEPFFLDSSRFFKATRVFWENFFVIFEAKVIFFLPDLTSLH